MCKLPLVVSSSKFVTLGAPFEFRHLLMVKETRHGWLDQKGSREKLPDGIRLSIIMNQIDLPMTNMTSSLIELRRRKSSCMLDSDQSPWREVCIIIDRMGRVRSCVSRGRRPQSSIPPNKWPSRTYPDSPMPSFSSRFSPCQSLNLKFSSDNRCLKSTDTRLCASSWDKAVNRMNCRRSSCSPSIYIE